MALINDDMRSIIASCGLGYAATVTPDGAPNLSPKGSLAVWDEEHLYFADIASPQTIENLRHNPGIEVNAVDIVKRRGYRFRGTGEVVSEGPVFDKAAQVLHDAHGPQYPCNHAVLIHVDEVRPLLSPAYMFNETPVAEDDLAAIWRGKLGLAGDETLARRAAAYEKVLSAILNFRSVEEVRDVFSREVTQEAADGFAEALNQVRDRGQPDEYAMADAIEHVIILRSAENDVTPEELERLFNDPDHHEMPSEEITSRVVAVWERTAS
jgi:uncharacterized protein